MILTEKLFAQLCNLAFALYEKVLPRIFYNDVQIRKTTLSFEVYVMILESYLSLLSFLRRNPGVLKNMQKLRLRIMLRAAERTPWWQSYFKKMGVPPEAIRRTHLTTIPPEELISYKLDNFYIQVNRTSGSTTGTPFSVAFHKSTALIDVAGHYIKTLEDFGFDFKKNAYKNFFFHFNIFGGVKKLTTAPEQFATPTSLTQRENAREKIQKIVGLMGVDDVVFFTHPSELPVFLHTVEDLAVKPSIKVCMVIGQVMESGLRLYTEKVLRCPVVSIYGFRERMITATSCCTHPELLHIHEERSILEILDGDGKSVPDGIFGNVTITALDNPLQPLIRYQPGDVGKIHNAIPCSCENKGPLLEIESRSIERFVFEDGLEKPAQKFLKYFSSEEALTYIERIQVRQEALNMVRVLIVPRKNQEGKRALLEIIEKRVRDKNFFPNTVVLTFEEVPNIGDDSAKYNAFIGLPKNQIPLSKQ